MNKDEARRVSIIESLLENKITTIQAAELCGLSTRQIKRLKKKASENGIYSVLHGNRDRKPKHAKTNEVKEKIIQLYKGKYSGFNFRHFVELLDEEEQIQVSYSYVETTLKKAGFKSPRKHKKKRIHRTRPRRDSFGELVQLDASKHDWFSNGKYAHLHGAIDDATGRVLALFFEKEETLSGYSELIYSMNRSAGLPQLLYTDGRTVFDSGKKKKLTIEEELAGIEVKETRFEKCNETL